MDTMHEWSGVILPVAEGGKRDHRGVTVEQTGTKDSTIPRKQLRCFLFVFWRALFGDHDTIVIPVVDRTLLNGALVSSLQIPWVGILAFSHLSQLGVKLISGTWTFEKYSPIPRSNKSRRIITTTLNALRSRMKLILD